MDTSKIKVTEINDQTGLQVGDSQAPKKIVEFVNLSCPYCKKWFDLSDSLLEEAVLQGKVQRVIKLFDKEKASLQPGNIMHQYVDFQDPQTGYQALKKMIASQNDWRYLSLEEVAAYAENTLGLSKKDNQAVLAEIVVEAQAAEIQFVPTNIIGTEIFDENISHEMLSSLLLN